MPYQKDPGEYPTPEEFEKFSPSLADYVRAVFGLSRISHKTEQELWERLTPAEQIRATEITKRLVKFKTDGIK